jgi:hypothetical protein
MNKNRAYALETMDDSVRIDANEENAMWTASGGDQKLLKDLHLLKAIAAMRYASSYEVYFFHSQVWICFVSSRHFKRIQTHFYVCSIYPAIFSLAVMRSPVFPAIRSIFVAN